MADLLAGNSSESESDFKINNDYAERYNKWRGKEELQKLKDRYGDVDINHDESSSSESEEEDLTNVIDKQFLRTLGCLKSNNPKIYDKKEVFFSEQTQPKLNAGSKRKRKDKTMYISDYKRKIILEKNGILSDEDDDDKGKRPLSPTYDEEQQQLKDSFKTALEESDNDDNDDNDGLLKERSKTKQQQVEEEKDYLRWLKGEVGETEDIEDLAKLKAYWEDPKLDSGEAFLRDYILNQRFLDMDQEKLPTYDDIVNDVSEDESELKKQETFEHKYNFRFEEPDPEFIKSYPRTMENSLRRKDDRRKKKREEVKLRKQQEKESKREELNRLKALKRAEILERLESLKEVTGGNFGMFNENDLQDDFDPEEHDRKMKAIFNEEYYAEGDETLKPEFPPDEELDAENWDNWNGGGEDYETENFNMDAEWDDNANQQLSGSNLSFQNEMLDSSRKKKRRRRSRFAQALTRQKPVFNPEERTFEEYLDDYYKLDYEDIIGDQPVRFPYRTVPANDFGLSTEEILLAKDKELNKWCSLKKTCQYRTDEEEKYDVQAFTKKAQNENNKMKCLPSLFQIETEDKTEEKVTTEDTKRKRKRRRNNDSVKPRDNELDDDRLKAFGINPKKHKNKLKYKK